MNTRKLSFCRLAALLVILLLCTIPAMALDITVDPNCTYCLSETDFFASDGALDGIYISSVPASSACTIRYGSRTLRAGDVLPTSALSQVYVSPASGNSLDGTLTYCPIANGTVDTARQLRFSFLRGQNKAPTALDCELETYKNIANEGTLNVTDPDGDALTFTITAQPKRGTVDLREDGTFTYTPKENKVGKDKFTFYAEDPAGNRSEEATVSIRILKPLDAARYTDMASHDGEYYAMWLKETGAYTGSQIAGNLCFCPDMPISRGEFLVMAMQVFSAQPEQAALTAGFTDEQQIPDWMRPYVVSALRTGVIGGSASQDGLYFHPTAELTRAEAAIIVQNLAQIPQAHSVFAGDETVPVWARSAMQSLDAVGVSLDAPWDGSMTRMEAAELLYDAHCLHSQPEI